MAFSYLRAFLLAASIIGEFQGTQQGAPCFSAPCNTVCLACRSPGAVGEYCESCPSGMTPAYNPAPGRYSLPNHCKQGTCSSCVVCVVPAGSYSHAASFLGCGRGKNYDCSQIPSGKKAFVKPAGK